MQAAALILVDLQNDFMPGGALAVPTCDEVIPLINRLLPYFRLVIATQDWHPADHGSFATQHPGYQPGDTIDLAGLAQLLWPVHCVQHTYGAALSKALDLKKINQIIPKGTNPQIDSYSGFFDNGHKQATGLAQYLYNNDIQHVYICGIATDYCVKFTALDACQLGFNTYLIEDACRGVNLQPNDSLKAIAKMRQSGVTIITSQDIFEHGPQGLC